MSDAAGGRSVAGNGIYSVLAAVVSAASLLVTYKVAAGTSGIEAIGTWAIALSITTLAGTADLGFPMAMAREIAGLGARAEWGGAVRLVAVAVVFSAAATFMLAGLLIPVVEWILESFVLKGGGEVPPGLLLACAIAVACSSVALTLTATLEGLERYDMRFWSLAFGNAAMVAAILELAPAMGSAGIAWSFAVLHGGTALMAGILVCRAFARRVSGSRSVKGAPARALALQAVRIGIPLRVAGLAAFFFEPIARFYFGALAGPAMAGIYDMASRLCAQTHGLISGGVQVLVPRMITLRTVEQSGGRELLADASRLTAIAASMGYVALMLGCGVVSALLLGHVDRDLVFLVVLLGAAWMFHVLASPAYFANIVDGAVHWNWISQWSAVVVSIFLAPICWYFFGWQAIAVGPFAGLVVATLVALVSRRYRTGEPMVNLSVGDLRTVGSVAALLGACQLGSILFLPSATVVWTSAITLAAFCLFALWFVTGAVSRSKHLTAPSRGFK